jgi:hypothetical protein
MADVNEMYKEKKHTGHDFGWVHFSRSRIPCFYVHLVDSDLKALHCASGNRSNFGGEDEDQEASCQDIDHDRCLVQEHGSDAVEVWQALLFKRMEGIHREDQDGCSDMLEFRFRDGGFELRLYMGHSLWRSYGSASSMPRSIKLDLPYVQLTMFMGWRDDLHHACSSCFC